VSAYRRRACRRGGPRSGTENEDDIRGSVGLRPNALTPIRPYPDTLPLRSITITSAIGEVG
jgi:hypothetical protein